MVTVRKYFICLYFYWIENDVLNCALFFPCVYDVHVCAYSAFACAWVYTCEGACTWMTREADVRTHPPLLYHLAHWVFSVRLWVTFCLSPQHWGQAAMSTQHFMIPGHQNSNSHALRASTLSTELKT